MNWAPTPSDRAPWWPCTLENARCTQTCSSADGQAMPSFGISENKSWSLATMFPRECWPSKPINISQTLNTRYLQTTREYATTWTMPGCREMLVMTCHGTDNSQHSPSSINTNHHYPTELQNLQSSQSTTQMLDIHCWWMKHLRFPIGDQERGWIDYFNHQFQSQLSISLLLSCQSLVCWATTSDKPLASNIFHYLEAEARRWDERGTVNYSTVPYGTVPGIPFLEKNWNSKIMSRETRDRNFLDPPISRDQC